MFGETLSWWTPTRTTTKWPPVILGLPSLFLEMSVCQLMYHGISAHLNLSKHVMRNISRFRLRAHTLKVEAAAWLEDGSCVCDQCPGENEHVQNEVHALLFCQDHRVCELRKLSSFLFTPFFKDFSATQPFLLQQVSNQLVHGSGLTQPLCLLQFGMIICTDISEWRGLSKSLARLQWIWLCRVARITLHLRSFSGGASSLGGILIQMSLRFLIYLCWKV